MGALDLVLVSCAVAGAAGFLVWQIGLKRRRPTSCHDDGGEDRVVLGPALARGLKRARGKT